MKNGKSSSSNRRSRTETNARPVDSASTGIWRDAGGVSAITNEAGSSASNVGNGETTTELQRASVSGVASGSGGVTASANGTEGRLDGTTRGKRGRPRLADSGTASVTGTATAGTAGTEAQQANGLAAELADKPVIRRRRGKNKSAEEPSKELIVLGAAISLQTIFHGLSFKLGAHWQLKDNEVSRLAQDLDAALSTLPGEYYAQFITYISAIAPWLALTVTASSIIVPRIQVTNAERKANRNATTPVRQVVDNPKPEQGIDDGAWRASTVINARVPSV